MYQMMYSIESTVLAAYVLDGDASLDLLAFAYPSSRSGHLLEPVEVPSGTEAYFVLSRPDRVPQKVRAW